MSLKTSLVVQKVVSDSVVNPPDRPSGYRVDLTVTEQANITNKIFVMQRGLQAAGSTNYESTFYSVATVADLEEIPVIPTDGKAFYLTNTISLIFRTMEELLHYTEDIETLINQLIRDNDRVINGTGPTLLGFPVGETLLRFWGIFSNSTVTDAELLEFFQDDHYSRSLDAVFSSDEQRYIYFAYRAGLGDPTEFKINGVAVTPVLVTRAVLNKRGYSSSYRIYRTPGTFMGLNLNLHVR